MSDSSYTDGTAAVSAISATDPMRERIAQAVNDVRSTTPLAQSFTNFVTINLVANAQLAAGGTAAMSFLPDDIVDTAKIAGSTYINVGTLLPFYQDALADIAPKLQYLGKPWVLDPVAAGIGKTRTAILQSFKAAPPTVIRGNASEIIALDAMWELGANDGAEGETTRPAGVEAVDEVEAAVDAAGWLGTAQSVASTLGVQVKQTSVYGCPGADDNGDDNADMVIGFFCGGSQANRNEVNMLTTHPEWPAVERSPLLVDYTKHELAHRSIMIVCGTTEPEIAANRTEAVTNSYAVQFLGASRERIAGSQQGLAAYAMDAQSDQIAQSIHNGTCA